LIDFPTLQVVPKIITEWGINSETDTAYDESISAAHSVAVVRNAFYGIDKLFAFELVDGPSPHNNKFWGRWGLITHPKFGISEKPRFKAFQMLNQITGNWLKTEGEGTFVQVLAVQTEEEYRILMANYDPQKRNNEQVPVKMINVPNGKYMEKIERLEGTTTNKTIDIADGVYTSSVIMPPNAVVMIKLIKQ
jgi:hypothetical protein